MNHEEIVNTLRSADPRRGHDHIETIIRQDPTVACEAIDTALRAATDEEENLKHRLLTINQKRQDRAISHRDYIAIRDELHSCLTGVKKFRRAFGGYHQMALRIRSEGKKEDKLRDHADRMEESRVRLRMAIIAHRDATLNAEIEPEPHDLALWNQIKTC